MLRKYVGDEAFFASLKLYLETNKFGSAEAHDLRLAFEKVTGEDLNWFFNEWYFSHGHPVIEINYNWNDSTGTQTVTVEQKQDFENNPLFRIPLLADVYHDGTVDHKKIVLEKAKEVFEWKYSSRPDLVNMDAERMLLCEKKDNKSKENYVFQFYHAPLYLDRFESLNKTGTDYEANTPLGKMMEDALKDRYWSIRVMALKNIGNQLKANKEKLKPVILDLAAHDSIAAVRAQAIKTISKYFKDDEEAKKTAEDGVHDISYNVQATAFKYISENDKVKAGLLAKDLESSNGGDVLNAVATFYKEEAKDDRNVFFLDALSRLHGYTRGSFADIYGKYLKKVGIQTWQKGVDKLEQVAGYSSGYGRKMILNTLEELASDQATKSADAKAKAEELKKNNGGKNEIDLALREADEFTARQNSLKDRLKKLEEKKTGDDE